MMNMININHNNFNKEIMINEHKMFPMKLQLYKEENNLFSPKIISEKERFIPIMDNNSIQKLFEHIFKITCMIDGEKREFYTYQSNSIDANNIVLFSFPDADIQSIEIIKTSYIDDWNFNVIQTKGRSIRNTSFKFIPFNDRYIDIYNFSVNNGDKLIKYQTNNKKIKFHHNLLLNGKYTSFKNSNYENRKPSIKRNKEISKSMKL